MMVLQTFRNGDVIERLEKALIVRLKGCRRVLSTSALNGGIRDDLKYIFNHDCKEDGVKNVPMKAPTYEEHLKIVAEELGLDAQSACGLTTAADMIHAAVAAETYGGLTVTAVVTGGIDVNGGRVGDPAGWHETDGISAPAAGTINILLFIGARLPAGTLARALITCTEAKTAALQELLASSMYSSGIATGSGTDGAAIIADNESPVTLTYAGKHSKLGELIGRTVMTAVKEALCRQTGLGPVQQFDVFSRIGRYGITREKILASCPDTEKVDMLAKRPDIVVMTSLYVHLLDQLSWGLISPQDAIPAAQRLLEGMGTEAKIHPQTDVNTATEAMLKAFSDGLSDRLNACI